MYEDIHFAGSSSLSKFILFVRYSHRGTSQSRDLTKGKIADIEKLKDFILEHKPHVIGLPCEGRYVIISQIFRF